MDTLDALLTYAHLFEGIFDFEQLANLPIPYLNDLVEAQIRVRTERAKAEKEAYRKAQESAASSSNNGRGRRKAF